MTTSPSADAITDRIMRLGRELQAAGVPVALAELIDATQAAGQIDIGQRHELRAALAATLVKSHDHIARFDAAFDRLFPARVGSGGPLPADLGATLDADDPQALQATADALVDSFGGLDDEARSERHHVERVWRSAELGKLGTDAARRERLAALRGLIAESVRARLPDPSADLPDVTEIDFVGASRHELDELRTAVRPLARKLATRLARRRQAMRTGRVDLRRTARRSTSTGGVPFDLAYRRPRPHRPELVVLCDISGSVADFSSFMLTLMGALSQELVRTRSFVFVDGLDEVTALLHETDHAIEPWQLLRNTSAIGADGHSDYGRVLDAFWQGFGADLTSRSTLLVCGDARTNYREPAVETLAGIARRVRHVYWLDPEPTAAWDNDDSVIGLYKPHCTAVFEVRNLRQLVACVAEIL